MTRHQVGIRDALVVTTMMLGVGVVAYQFDFGGGVSEDKRIEFQEAIGLGVLFVIVLSYFGWRRLSEQEREIERRIVAENRAHELANTDALTGLANRRKFEQALKETVTAPPGAEDAHAVLLLDLNGFKKINDVYGHQTGDDVLFIVAQRLSGAMRDGDVLARLGGDEFAVIARHLAGAEGATGIALRIMKSIESPVEVGSIHHRIGTGIGIALISEPGADPEEVLRRADIALYRAKAEGQSTMRFFEEEMDRHSRERELLERELADAVSTNSIAPWYQPIVDLKTQRVIAFEALARWTHPTLGAIPPERFIPIAEDCGLIRQLSDQLLRSACADARDWPDDVLLSFNISPVQLKEKTLGLRILNILAETGMSPRRLEIEITESAIVRDLESAKTVLSALRDAGVRIALDDFGTGYSSLYHLRNFKFDAIKIDRSFVGNMASESESAEIVRALTGLGHGLGLSITAEGIELFEQCDALVQQGCQQGQGFLFSSAIPAHEAKDFVSSPHSRKKQGAA